MPVWRSRSRKRLDSADVRLRRGSKLVGHNIIRTGYLEVVGNVAPHWREGVYVNFVPKPAATWGIASKHIYYNIQRRIAAWNSVLTVAA
jgi:hypothetical protein